jgi:hypothetical protein
MLLRILTREAFENAIAVLMALGGRPTRWCTDRHRRARGSGPLDDFDRIARRRRASPTSTVGRVLMEDYSTRAACLR